MWMCSVHCPWGSWLPPQRGSCAFKVAGVPPFILPATFDLLSFLLHSHDAECRVSVLPDSASTVGVGIGCSPDFYFPATLYEPLDVSTVASGLLRSKQREQHGGLCTTKLFQDIGFSQLRSFVDFLM
jgi:hypothetical protein